MAASGMHGSPMPSYAPQHHHYYHLPPSLYRPHYPRPGRRHGKGNYHRKAKSHGRNSSKVGQSKRKSGQVRKNKSQKSEDQTRAQKIQSRTQARAGIPVRTQQQAVKQSENVGTARDEKKSGTKKKYWWMVEEAEGKFVHPRYKTTMCKNLAQGSCKFGDACVFAHSKAELRPWSQCAAKNYVTRRRGKKNVKAARHCEEKFVVPVLLKEGGAAHVKDDGTANVIAERAGRTFRAHRTRADSV